MIDQAASILHNLIIDCKPKSLLTLSELTTSMHELRIFLYQGLIPTYLLHQVSGIVGSVQKAKQFIIQSLNFFYQDLYTNI